MNILGIACFYHDSAATLVKEGEQKIRNIQYDITSLKKFALLFFVLFAIFTVFSYYKESPNTVYVLCFSILFLVLRFLFTQILKPVYSIWMSLSVILGYFATRVILLVLLFIWL